ncbi:MAG: hypothetical protein VX641_07280 [Planctomycetota bacterium]|nr:hypothetical protein [Planctomycetota bacterium]
MPLITGRRFAVISTVLCAGSVCSLSTHADLAEAPPMGMTISGASGWSYWVGNDDGWVGNPAPELFEYAGDATWDECWFAWENEVEVDPGLGFGLTITNTQSFTETFNIIVDVAVPGWSDGTLQGASIGGSVTDTSFDGSASLVAADPSLMGAFLDGTRQINLGKGLDLSVDILGGTSTFGPFNEGLSGSAATIVGPSTTDGFLSIAIDFTLTPGDTASFTGGYLVEYVPSPAAILVLGGLGVARRRRR